MALIRHVTIDDNAAYRGGCQFQSPHTGQIYYATVEHGTLYLRRWDRSELGHDGPVALSDPKLSACFANAGEVCVTVSGFHAGTNDSAIDTYLLSVQE